jgi:hypothetical protein
MAADQPPKKTFAGFRAFLRVVFLICSPLIRAESGWNSVGMTTRENARKRARTTTKEKKKKDQRPKPLT